MGHNAMHAAHPKHRSSSTTNAWFNCRAMNKPRGDGSSLLRRMEAVSCGTYKLFQEPVGKFFPILFYVKAWHLNLKKECR